MTERVTFPLRQEIRWYRWEDLLKLGRARLPRFPHFTPEESAVMWGFIKDGVLRGLWAFDVRLFGKYAYELARRGDYFSVREALLLAKRIDALVDYNDALHIVEVKRRLLHSAIGQLITYREMLVEQWQPERPVLLWAVYAIPDPDVEKICKKSGINTYWVRWV